jgi:APA family basic amino acid/polyamine antiporter
MKLDKGISFWGVFSIASGAMISSGIFILPGFAYAKTGPTVFISYFIAGFLGFLGILSVIELATAMPKAGGDYYFVNKTFGPVMGTISGFLGWFALSLKSAFAIFGISEILYLFLGLNFLVSGLILCLFFVFLNIIGVKEAIVFQIIMVTGLFSLMMIYIIAGLPQMERDYFSPFLEKGINQIIATSGFIFISFGGLLNVANISEEVKNPQRNIPMGIIVSIIVVTLFYTAITFVITGTLPPHLFKESLTPVADSSRIILGQPGYYIILVASLLAFFTTANAGIMSASRYPMALSRDNLLPDIFGRVNNKFKTPTLAVLLTGIIIYLSLLLPLEILVKSASTVILTSYILTNIAIIILRESHITNYRPSFKSPFYPYLQILCVFLFTFFIIDLGLEAIEISLAFIFISVCIYMFYGRKIKNKESALLHLLKRITDSKLTENLLEDELREVLIDRDEIVQDNFDKLIKKAPIIDLERTISFEELIKQLAPDIAEEINIPDKEIISLFLERQKNFNMAVSPFLAIPHIVVKGKDKMFMRIIRSREGIYFTEKESHIKAVFLLGGTEDNRNLHLKTIASMATLTGIESFQKDWLSAKSGIELKNLMILNNRKRFL